MVTISDKRYSIGLEFCGHKEQKHVVRFCGDFVTSCDSRDAAVIAVIEHQGANGRESDWRIVARIDHVLWLFDGKQHRVAYGADVVTFRKIKTENADIEAAHRFGECVLHQSALGD